MELHLERSSEFTFRTNLDRLSQSRVDRTRGVFEVTHKRIQVSTVETSGKSQPKGAVLSSSNSGKTQSKEAPELVLDSSIVWDIVISYQRP